MEWEHRASGTRGTGVNPRAARGAKKTDAALTVRGSVSVKPEQSDRDQRSAYFRKGVRPGKDEGRARVLEPC